MNFSALPGDSEKQPLPWIDVALVGPTSAVERTALIDTGSSVSVFPTSLLKSIGVNFDYAEVVPALVGGGTTFYKLGEPKTVDCVFDGHDAMVLSYGSDDGEIVMLGVNDFLKHFDLTVNKINNRFRLDPAVPGCCPGITPLP